MIIRSLSLVLFSAVVMFITTTISSSTKVNAHSFELCPGYTDHLHVSEVEMSPERPSANKPFSLKVKFKPDATYEKPLEVDVSVKVFGVKVYSYKFDACSDEAAEYVKCPLKGGVEQTLEAKTTLPSEVPRNIAANVQITIYHKDSPVTCISTLVHTDSRLQSESEQEQEFIDYFVNTFSYDEESVEFNEALRVGESNSVNYLLTQRQNNHKFVQGMRFLYQKWLEEFHQLAEIEEWYPVHDKSSKITFEKRFLVFVKNFIDIVIHNRKFREGKTSYAKKMNQFGHLHPHEFRAIFLSGYRSDLKKPSLFDELSKFFGKAPIKLIPSSPSAELDKVMNHIKSDQVPESIDWVEKGAVNPVKNQGSCGSCWAFSAISALESACFLKYGELKSFSEQELVSCEGDCYGCRGGIMSNAFNWIHRHGGVCTDKDYAYTSGTTGVSGFCKASRCKADLKSAVKNYVVVDHTDKGLKEAVAKQPVSVAVEADQYAFQFYSHGVLTGECGDRDNHGVVVVGYGNLDGTDYWKVRNSWGASWGMQGYILIQRGDGVQEQNGKCGILVDPLYPVL